MKKYADRKRAEVNDYKVGDLVMLSTKDLKYQMVKRRTDKLMERFVSPYKIKKIVSSNAIELELPRTVKLHSVVNVSRIQCYVGQVEGQRKKQPACHDLAKQLSYYLYFFSFILDLLHRRKCGKVSCHKCHIVTSHDRKSQCHIT